VDKLIKANFIREVQYATWLGNIIPIRKKNSQLYICVDFRDLNNACPKDDFPLLITELLMDATTGFEALSFMNGFSRYNQIKMDPKDEELMAFRTPQGIDYYTVMPVGLKNVEATYQRAMTIIFRGFLHNLVHIDDLVVKTKDKENHPHDLIKVFEKLRQHQLKMNPLKCVFGVTSGKFFSFLVRKKGIEIGLGKVKSIIQMSPLRNLRELRGLHRSLAYKVLYLKFVRKLSTFHKTSEKGHTLHLESNLSKCS